MPYGGDTIKMLGAAVGRLKYDELQARIERVMTGKFSCFRSFAEQIGQLEDKHVIIVAGGASIDQTIKGVKRLTSMSHRNVVITVNKTHDYLINKKGFVPGKNIHAAVLCDPADWIADYITPHKKIGYFLASQLHDDTLRRFLPIKDNVFIWHGGATYPEGNISKWAKKKWDTTMAWVEGRNSTVGLCALMLAIGAGARTIDIHGFDSCILKGRSMPHPYTKPRPLEAVMNTTITAPDGRQFSCIADPNMMRQATEYEWLMNNAKSATFSGEDWRAKVRVFGDGLIPWLAWCAQNPVFECAEPWRFERAENPRLIDYRSPEARIAPQTAFGETKASSPITITWKDFEAQLEGLNHAA